MCLGWLPGTVDSRILPDYPFWSALCWLAPCFLASVRATAKKTRSWPQTPSSMSLPPGIAAVPVQPAAQRQRILAAGHPHRLLRFPQAQRRCAHLDLLHLPLLLPQGTPITLPPTALIPITARNPLPFKRSIKARASSSPEIGFPIVIAKF